VWQLSPTAFSNTFTEAGTSMAHASILVRERALHVPGLAAVVRRGATSNGYRSLHLLAGAGGDARGLAEAGFTPVGGLNHKKHCVDTLIANFAGDWRCNAVEEIAVYDLPAHDVMFGSAICTEVSQNGGRVRTRGQQSIFAEDNQAQRDTFARTRTTAYGIFRFAKARMPKLVFSENVPPFVTDWGPEFWQWYAGWKEIGYRVQLACIDAAHVSGEGNPAAPSWRPRIVIVASRDDVAMPNLEVRPLAWCLECRQDVRAQQVWNRPSNRAGAYRKQFWYHCPRRGCRQLVEPYTRSAADAFDLTNVGEPLRGRKRKSAESTYIRLKAAAEYLGTGYARRLSRPVPKASINGRYHCVIEWRNHADCSSIYEPLTTITAQGRHHGLVTAPEGWEPGKPLDILDCCVRSITPAEQARAVRLPKEHILLGQTDTELTSLAGNVVAVNVAHFLGKAGASVL
jgi:DNA (cytosine-5)-methyltransferase 1